MTIGGTEVWIAFGTRKNFHHNPSTVLHAFTGCNTVSLFESEAGED